jgi:hypothetical protein
MHAHIHAYKHTLMRTKRTGSIYICVALTIEPRIEVPHDAGVEYTQPDKTVSTRVRVSHMNTTTTHKNQTTLNQSITIADTTLPHTHTHIHTHTHTPKPIDPSAKRADMFIASCHDQTPQNMR